MLSLTAFLALMGVIGAVVGGLSSLGTTAYNAEQQQQANEANIAAAEKMQQENQAFNRQSAEIANAETRRQYWDLYSPQAKVNQLKQAGLSVGLMYGGSGMGGGGSTAAQAGSSNAIAPTIQPTFMNDILGSMIAGAGAPSEIAKRAAETEGTKAETNKTNTEISAIEQSIKESNQRIKESEASIEKIIAEAQTEQERKIGQGLQNRHSEIDIENAKLELDFNKATFKDKQNLIHTSLDKMMKEYDILDEQLKQEKVNTEYAEQMKKEEIKNLQASRNKMVAETALTWMKTETEKYEQDLLEWQKYETIAKTNKNFREAEAIRKDIEKAEAEIDNLKSMRKKIDAETDSAKEMTKKQQLENSTYKIKLYIDEGCQIINTIANYRNSQTNRMNAITNIVKTTTGGGGAE